jgi:hypothetical protein
MVRVIVLFAVAALCALITRSPSTQPSWSEGAPESWARLDLSAIQDAGDGFMCPMDRDVTSKTAGFCPRCRMKLVKIETSPRAESVEYPVRISTEPSVLRPGTEARLAFHIDYPETHQAVRDFEVVHEKLYHVFLVSQDLTFFLHTHPQPQPDSSLDLDVRFPKPGMYRILSDFYPKGGTPQLVANTLIVPGAGLVLKEAKLAPDLTPQRAQNLEVELMTEPVRPAAHGKTQLLFRLKPNNGIEPYLGAMAHMLAASSDLIDMMHSHPLQVTDGSDYKQLQFQMIFPRAGIYRVWVQSQRKGIVNTVAFNIPVEEN